MFFFLFISVMSTEYGERFIFQLVASALPIKKVREGQHNVSGLLAN